MGNLYGFSETERQNVDEINGEARVYLHEKTGARVLSLINGDENKVFGITFRTPPADSTGIAHILEHSVLCGSRKFPIKDPFIRLAQGSLNTFLNAMTFPDKTSYPAASQNLQDFYNLVDVYLDAALHPLISRETFEQEGWHYELSSPEAPLIYKGVVFNEMKGAYSSPNAVLYKLCKQSLFPDTTYGLDSGGDPVEIPKLTYDALKTFHANYYHPSNAWIYFYGDDDPAERLRLLDARLSEFTAHPVKSDIALQPRLTGPVRAEGTYAAGQEAGKAKSHLSINWMLGGNITPEDALALYVLDEALSGTSAAPLRRILIDSGLGEEVIGSFDTGLRQATASCGLKGIDPAHSSQVETLILDTLKDISAKGFDKATVEAALNTVEFKLRENNTGRFPRGLSLMLRSLTTWLHEGNPLERIQFTEPLKKVKARIAAGEPVLEKLIKEQLIDNPHRTTVIVKPDPKQGERETAHERAHLAQIRAGLDSTDIEKLVARTAELQRWQNTPDTAEAVAAIPTLKLSDLPKKNKTISSQLSDLAGAEVLGHELHTNGILYLDLAFHLHSLTVNQLPMLNVLARAFQETGAGDFDFIGLTERIGRNTGGISMGPYVSALGDGVGSECAACLMIRAKAVADKTDELVAILHDMLINARIDDRTRIKQIVLEEKASAEARLAPMGHVIAARRMAAGLNKAGFVQENISGLTRLFALRSLAEKIDTDWPSVAADLEVMRRQLITRNGVTASVTAEPNHLSQFMPRLEKLIAALPPKSASAGDNWTWTPGAVAEGFAIPANVNYVSKGGDLGRFGLKSVGAALVAQKFLSTTWLWDKVRLQGGAYGGFCRFDRLSKTFTYLSYRDPNLLETLEVYDGTAEYLRQAPLSGQDLTRAIIGTISDIDTYLLPDAKGLVSLQRHLVKDSEEARQTMRDEVLSVTAGDIRAFADVLDSLKDHGHIAVLGSDAALKAANAAHGKSWLTISQLM